MVNYFRTCVAVIFLIVFVSASFSKKTYATQDVEDPNEVIGFIRLLLSEPSVASELHRLVDEGCTWVDQVFWSGNSNDESLKTRMFWMTFSMKIATQSGKQYWKQYLFSRKGIPVLEVIETTDPNSVVDCSQ